MDKDKDKRRSFGQSNSVSKSESSSNNIKVVCRFRPPKHGEVIANSDTCHVDLDK